MNKKEVLEIRKQFTPERCTISQVCGCYVDGDKNKKLELKETFLCLPEEEVFKYLDLFKQTLSGTIGKNLLNMEFPLEQELPGGRQEFLLKLRNSKLQDDMLLEEFYDQVIASYNYGENYLILLIHVTYDIPGKATDGTEMFDASDNVYEYILCSICPVKLTKPGLCYNASTNSIEDRIRDWIVDAPAKGFLFPVFNDRAADIHGVLYYSRKPEELQPDFIEQVLGSAVPMSAESQKETFHTILEESLGEECSYQVVKTIHDTLNEMIEEKKDDPEPLLLSKTDVKKVLEQSGVADEKIEEFEKDYDTTAGEQTSLLASNITNLRKFSIQTPDIVIQVNPERTDLIETRIIDGKQCLVITVDDHIEVNGMNVRTISQKMIKEIEKQA
ncbi:DUF4317 domain-containing protein [Anaerolentibacter hominis]|uniref:DUF4317 domain-containing protein n=1 Tax=Anaerolentibacter hominis TaxID=3079009 RepID=UPI0031B87795